MHAKDIEAISAWVVERGLAGDPRSTLLNGFCERCERPALALSRGIAIIDTLHPVYEGRAFFWARDRCWRHRSSSTVRAIEGAAAEQWHRSPFFHLLQSGDSELRCRLEKGETAGSRCIEELRQEGQTDYLAMVQRFGREAAIGEMDCFLSRWLTDAAGRLQRCRCRRASPAGAGARPGDQVGSLARVAESLVEAYLGRDAGRRVLAGRMSRGAVEKIHAVLWFSDIRGYTALSEDMAVRRVDPPARRLRRSGDLGGARRRRRCAEADRRRRAGDLRRRRSGSRQPAPRCRPKPSFGEACRAEGAPPAARLPVASIYVGIHIGDVFYGNIGSKDRLDFTVVGEAVNEVEPHRVDVQLGRTRRPVLVRLPCGAAG